MSVIFTVAFFNIFELYFRIIQSYSYLKLSQYALKKPDGTLFVTVHMIF